YLPLGQRPGGGRTRRTAIITHELQRGLNDGHVGPVLLLRAKFLKRIHHPDELVGAPIVPRLEGGMNGDRMRGPDIDQAGGEAARTDSAGGGRPPLTSPPPNPRIPAPNHFRETQRRWASPLHPGDARHATELLDRIETDPVVAQV